MSINLDSRVYELSKRFNDAAQLLGQQDSWLSVPAIMNAALSIELLLKALTNKIIRDSAEDLSLSTDNDLLESISAVYPKVQAGHKLDDIFEKINQQTKDLLTTKYREKHSSDLRAKLAEFKNVFIDSRYFYEAGKPSLSNEIINLSNNLHLIIKQLLQNNRQIIRHVS